MARGPEAAVGGRGGRRPTVTRLQGAVACAMAVAMTTRCLTVIGLLLLGACANKSGASAPPAEPTTPAEPAESGADGERATLSTAECEAQGGQVVGDIGDGAIHRPEYRCEGGQPPLGSILPGEGEPVAIEGSVCCPKPV